MIFRRQAQGKRFVHAHAHGAVITRQERFISATAVRSTLCPRTITGAHEIQIFFQQRLAVVIPATGERS